LAPSVHNIQPTRWRQSGDAIEILWDRARRLPMADPTGHDVRLSHGAAFEGMSLALAARGLSAVDLHVRDPIEPGDLPMIATFRIAGDGPGAPLGAFVASRVTWRGKFEPAPRSAEATRNLDALEAASGDLWLIRDSATIADIANLGDRAGLHFMRDREHRNEMIGWMRLSKAHPNFHRDGLNARAMSLSPFEAFGAGLALGPLFGPLDRVGAAAILLSEAAKTSTAAAIALFHRPIGEDPFHTGRRFYSAWLEMERCNFKACPMSVLADWPESREKVSGDRIPRGRRLVNAFRLGVVGRVSSPHDRLPPGELLC
jgi:hypothetical protein